MSERLVITRPGTVCKMYLQRVDTQHNEATWTGNARLAHIIPSDHLAGGALAALDTLGVHDAQIEEAPDGRN